MCAYSILMRCAARRLYDAYAACDSVQSEEQLLRDIECGVVKKKIGPALSRAVRAFFRDPKACTE